MRDQRPATAVTPEAVAGPLRCLHGGQAPCPASWQLENVHDTAFNFFPHLLPGQFETAAEFEAVLRAAEDPDGDSLVCVKHMWGEDLNPKSHWYRLGFEVGLNEPVHLILVKNDRP